MRVRSGLRLLTAAAVAAALLAGCSVSAPRAAWTPGAGRTPALPEGAPLAIRLYDPYRLLPPGVLDLAESEVIRAFGAAGVPARFAKGGDPEAIPATVYREFPSRWNVVPEAIGVAIGERGGRRSVFLSLGAAERALGRQAGSGRRGARVGVALGRVLAHELVHAIAPECPHTSTGLMAARLDRRLLTAPGVGFDPLASRHLRRAWTESVLAAGALDAGPDL